MKAIYAKGQKRAQIRMGETIAVLIIFFFLLVMGVAFYYNVQKSKIYTSREETYAQESIRVSQIISYLPELQCSSENIVNDNCFDIYKVIAASDIIQNNQDFYFPFFRFSEISVEEIYPFENRWVLYNYTGNNTGYIPTYIPISLYDPIAKKYSFGVLNVAYRPFYG